MAYSTPGFLGGNMKKKAGKRRKRRAGAVPAAPAAAAPAVAASVPPPIPSIAKKPAFAPVAKGRDRSDKGAY